jgi:ABC-2 type transport system ATP-binding protein
MKGETMSFIEVTNISKEFQVYVRKNGFKNSIKSFFNRQYIIKKAVNDISFNVDKGELIGYIGPNGAGKSTTVKMLSGILIPTSGIIKVNGIIPYTDRIENARQIGVVFGQRSQLYWDLPVQDTFELYKKMYKVSDAQYKRNIAFYVELLEMQEFMQMPVRQLSLGQKMRANIAVALMHDPQIVYLDEPTIGLDIVAKSRIRRFIKDINKEKNITIILTTHDLGDIEQICSRLIMIDHGSIIYNGTLKDFRKIYNDGFMIQVDFSSEDVMIRDPRFKVISQEGPRKIMICNRNDISAVDAVSLMTSQYKITDLSIKEPDIEEIVRSLYESRK